MATPLIAKELQASFRQALSDAKSMRHEYLTLEHLLLALTRDGLIWRDAAGVWTLGPDPTGLLGELGYMAVDDEGVWLVGDLAIGYARPGLPAAPVIRPGQIPGRVTGVVADDSYLWVGTTRGLVRFRTAALRP